MQHTPGDIMVAHAKSSTAEVADTDAGSADLMAKLMGDWSWRPEMQLVDPGYAYTAEQRADWELFRDIGSSMPAVRPWMVSAYRGPEAKPKRIGG